MRFKDKIRKQHNELFRLNNRLRALVREMMAAKPQVNTPRDGVACFMLAKMYKTHGAALSLTKKGFAEDSDMLIRTLFDALLIMSACLKDETEETALKYLHFDYVTRTKMYKAVSKTETYQEWFRERQENPKPDDESVEEIQGQAQEWREEYGKDFWQRWHTGQTTGELAESVEQERYFATAYSMQSQLTHSLPRAMNLYLIDDGENVVMDVSPKERGTDLNLVSAFNMLVVAADKFNDHFGLGHEEELKQMVEEWPRAVDTDVKRMEQTKG